VAYRPLATFYEGAEVRLVPTPEGVLFSGPSSPAPDAPWHWGLVVPGVLLVAALAWRRRRGG
jgi:hypothetical protein